MGRFEDKWDPKASGSEKSYPRIKGPLRPMLEKAINSVALQIAKLDQITNRLAERDQRLFNRVVSSLERGNARRAAMFSSELVEIRRLSKMVYQGKLALEGISMRIGTVRDLGDIAAIITPAVVAVRSVQASLGSVVPEAEGSLKELSEMLGSILVHAGSAGALTLDFRAGSEDAERILREAAQVAEHRLRERLPSLPEGLVQEGIEAAIS